MSYYDRIAEGNARTAAMAERLAKLEAWAQSHDERSHVALRAALDRLATLEAVIRDLPSFYGAPKVGGHSRFKQMVSKVGPLPTTVIASAEQGPKRACLVFPSETCEEEGRCVYECQRKNRPASAEEAMSK